MRSGHCCCGPCKGGEGALGADGDISKVVGLLLLLLLSLLLLSSSNLLRDFVEVPNWIEELALGEAIGGGGVVGVVGRVVVETIVGAISAAIVRGAAVAIIAASGVGWRICGCCCRAALLLLLLLQIVVLLLLKKLQLLRRFETTAKVVSALFLLPFTADTSLALRSATFSSNGIHRGAGLGISVSIRAAVLSGKVCKGVVDHNCFKLKGGKSERKEPMELARFWNEGARACGMEIGGALFTSLRELYFFFLFCSF